MGQQSKGKRAGARRGPKKRTRPSRTALLLSLAITLCVVAWGFLVLAAIDFGSTARGGESQAWGYLALACVGAAACLFVGMILVGKLLRATGIITDPTPSSGTQRPVPDSRSSSETTRASQPTVTSYVDLPGADDTAERPPLRDDMGDTAERPAVRAPRAKGGKRAAR